MAAKPLNPMGLRHADDPEDWPMRSSFRFEIKVTVDVAACLRVLTVIIYLLT